MKTFCLIALSVLLLSCSEVEVPGADDIENQAEELICRSETDPQVRAMNDARSEMLAMNFIITRKLGFKYRIYKPAEASEPGEERFPLIIHLHGIDERGNDNIRHLDYIADSLVSYAKRHAAYVVCPQCPIEPYWSLKSRPDSFQPNNMELAPEASDRAYTSYRRAGERVSRRLHPGVYHGEIDGRNRHSRHDSAPPQQVCCSHSFQCHHQFAAVSW